VTVVLVDSNVLIDVTTDDPTWGEWSSRSLMQAADEAVLVIDALIYTEGSIGFDSIELLEEALPHDPYRREHLPFEAAFLAGKAFRRCRARRSVGDAPARESSARRNRSVSTRQSLATLR
jgi:hypothetical protein